ncbi:hypothetical protein [Alteraurantiacibacter aquimixticola]|uniref:Glycerophosphoryl diester phosphodiesterase membrane domain-containing protein n=1 Tax=Alteraurantiacibacter aquimixticola TaxID=2489173 RepID=A0A4V4U906_9SPHN|nr:hypothetical protein [Alteraurantiacibacter aquimixticola]TIX52007.1 hypothetical protein E5222_06150 [Alteraurantiacibacter aquimixticola]
MTDLIRDNSRDALLYVLVIGGIGALGVATGLTSVEEFDLSTGFMVDANDSPGSGLFELIGLIAMIVASYWLARRYLGSRGRLRSDENRFWSYLGMAILSGIGIVIGFVLLIVPGIFLLVRWSAATGFVIGEQRGVVDSLSASWDATKGHGWTIFLAALVLIIGLIIIGGIISLVFGLFGATLLGIVSAFMEAAGNAITIALGIAIYCAVSEGAEQVGEVFS